MSRIFILQSGFVTQHGAQLTRTAENDLSLKDSLYVMDRRVADTDNYYDEGIEKLFQQWYKDNLLMNRFEFRELVLENALRVFYAEQKTIDIWIRLQLPQRTVGYLHRRFLKDTMASVLNNTPMQMDNYNYYRLLQAQQSSNHLQHSKDPSNEELKEYVSGHHSVETVSILRTWTRDIKGFNDLLQTLHVIFGRRHGYMGVSAATAAQ